MTPDLARLALLCLLPLAACGGGAGGGSHGTSPESGPAECLEGMADGYPCDAIALAGHISLATFGAATSNDIWGWTDSQSGDEYALVGLDNGTAFVRVSDPENPTLIGQLPSQDRSSIWRDIKVYRDHAFIVADAAGAHGLQVFNLTRLRGDATGQHFSADAVYDNFNAAHNIAINDSSGFAYVVGSETCGGGLHIVDISEPLEPIFAGCHSADGYTHDAQCVAYLGPDPDYNGAEICFNSNQDSLAIVNVSDKSETQTLAVLRYPNLAFVHQAWLDDTQRYLLVGDESDELDFGVPTTTIVIDVRDLDAPSYLYAHRLTTRSIDHNLFVMGNRVFQANYTSGLRILEFSDLATDTLSQVGYFDTYPKNDGATLSGAWGVYPFFQSGTIIVSDRDRGLFILEPN